MRGWAPFSSGLVAHLCADMDATKAAVSDRDGVVLCARVSCPALGAVAACCQSLLIHTGYAIRWKKAGWAGNRMMWGAWIVVAGASPRTLVVALETRRRDSNERHRIGYAFATQLEVIIARKRQTDRSRVGKGWAIYCQTYAKKKNPTPPPDDQASLLPRAHVLRW